MTTYFITGGFGFLGQHIVQAIHEHDPKAELLVIGRTQRTTFLGVENLECVRFVQGDISKPETYEADLKGVDVVVHTAAMVSFSKSDKDAIFNANVVGTRNLSEAALKAGCKNFIFISSISAVGFNPPNVSDESSYPDLEYSREHDMYGYTKMINEKELAEVSDRMRVIMLNPSVILGPGSKRVADAFKMVRYLPVLPMLSYVNSFVDARDVAQAVVLSLTKGRTGERYIVSSNNANMLTFAKLALQAMGKKTLILPVAGAGVRLMDAVIKVMDWLKLNPGIRTPSEMVVDKVLSWEKIQKEMGWEPAYSLEQSVFDSLSEK